YTALPVFTATSSAEVIPKIRQVASKALELDPNFGEAHLQLGEAAFLEYDWAAAERELKMALELSPGDAVVHRWYSYYLGRMGRRALQRAAGMGSENFRIRGEIGYALAVSGKRAEAQTILARLLQQSKNGAAHSLPVAQVYIGLGEKDRAFEWLEKAVDQHEI